MSLIHGPESRWRLLPLPFVASHGSGSRSDGGVTQVVFDADLHPGKRASMRQVPQPHPSRITPFAGHAVVVGVTPQQPEVVLLTAAALAEAQGGPLYCAYADPGRVVEREFPDGSVEHSDLDPDLADDDEWRARADALTSAIGAVLAGSGVGWEFRYLAGRPDRALTHLARAVDAAVIVVGTRRPGRSGRLHDLLDGAVSAHLAHHQHRPVLVVPTAVVDWKTPLEWH